MKRREFIKKAVAGTTAAVAATTIGAPAIHASPKFQWKMVTTWPPKFPVFQESAEMIAKSIKEMSEGRLTIHVYGGGELVPPLEAFNAVSSGTVEMGHGCPYYWAGKVPGAQLIAAVPFGMNSQQVNSWITSGNGMKLWEELYAPFNVVPFLVGECGMQMGGWFRKEIKSINDIKGLKMRIPGLGGKVITKAGGTSVTVPAAEIYSNLERGVIDATEWVGPYHDYILGLYKAAKFYYYPGWHEPGTVIEAFINKKAWNSLPADLKAIVRAACAESNAWMVAEFDAKNNFYLNKLKKEHGVKVLKFPDDVMKELKKYSEEVVEEIASKDPMSKKIWADYKNFMLMIRDLHKNSEFAYADFIF